METMVSKTLLKVIGFLSSLLLTVFAGMFGLTAIGMLVLSAIDKDIISVLISCVCAFIGWVCWSVRKDVLL